MSFLLYLVRVEVKILIATDNKVGIEVAEMSALVSIKELVSFLELFNLLKFY